MVIQQTTPATARQSPLNYLTVRSLAVSKPTESHPKSVDPLSAQRPPQFPDFAMGRRGPETVQQMAIGQFTGALLELGVGRGE